MLQLKYKVKTKERQQKKDKKMNRTWIGYQKAYKRNTRTKLLFLYKNNYITRMNYMQALEKLNVL